MATLPDRFMMFSFDSRSICVLMSSQGWAVA